MEHRKHLSIKVLLERLVFTHSGPQKLYLNSVNTLLVNGKQFANCSVPSKPLTSVILK